jgi:uncharacterized membrane protein
MQKGTKGILYLGDTGLKEQASYIAGVMAHYKLGFDYVPSDAAFGVQLLDNHYKALIISDYPAANFGQGVLEQVAERVRGGMGLCMIGGWESFSGAKGEYTQSVLQEVLPVVMEVGDDRVNYSQTCLIEEAAEHEITAGLGFDIPPAIGGYNRLRAKAQSQTILLARRFAVGRSGGRFTFESAGTDPLLVVGTYGAGRVAAYASDAAPHWVGPFVDWGDRRVAACADGAAAVEVGNWYAEFFRNLICWTAQR